MGDVAKGIKSFKKGMKDPTQDQPTQDQPAQNQKDTSSEDSNSEKK